MGSNPTLSARGEFDKKSRSDFGRRSEATAVPSAGEGSARSADNLALSANVKDRVRPDVAVDQ